MSRCRTTKEQPSYSPLSSPYRLVLVTLNEALQNDPSRICFRLVGGVLVERTVKDVVPALRTNLEGVSVFMTLSNIGL